MHTMIQAPIFCLLGLASIERGRGNPTNMFVGFAFSLSACYRISRQHFASLRSTLCMGGQYIYITLDVRTRLDWRDDPRPTRRAPLLFHRQSSPGRLVLVLRSPGATCKACRLQGPTSDLDWRIIGLVRWRAHLIATSAKCPVLHSCAVYVPQSAAPNAPSSLITQGSSVGLCFKGAGAGPRCAFTARCLVQLSSWISEQQPQHPVGGVSGRGSHWIRVLPAAALFSCVAEERHEFR